MSGSIPSASLRKSTIQAYRALLRAASYLPDPAARIYCHKHIVFRFKPSVAPCKSSDRRDPADYRRLLLPDETKAANPRARKRLSTAWKWARLLEGAANGIERNLKRVLHETYGRTGKRKRQLIRDFLQPAESTLPTDEKALEDLIQNPSGPQAENFTPSEKLCAFMLSQQRETIVKFKHLSPPVQVENTWGRRLPLKVQKSIRHKWWAATLAKILPPLPEYEWNRLRDLSKGVIPAQSILPRREKPPPESLADDEVNQKVLQLFRTPRDVGNIDNIVFDAEKGFTISPKDPNEGDRILPKHEMGQRALRRLYAEIWQNSAKISQDGATRKWIIQWGGSKSRAQSGEVTTPSMKDLELFEGIGLLPEQKSKKMKAKVKRKDKANMHEAEAMGLEIG